MREIKFRSWNTGIKEMLHFGLDNCCKVIHLRKQNIIMQFTGIMDNNCKEIYEGDIIKLTTTYNKVDIEHIAKVVFEKGTFILGATTMCDSYMTFIEVDSEWDLEIIGNIHENPELIAPLPKKEKEE